MEKHIKTTRKYGEIQYYLTRKIYKDNLIVLL